MNQPLVSIIIPVCNAEKYIDEMINSALNQTWPNKEIIVVDDGSTDNSFIIAKKYANNYVKIFNQENKGASAARNKGITEAKGEYIQFLDADDVLKNDKIQLQLDIIKHTPGVTAYGGYVNFFDGENIDNSSYGTYLDRDYLNGIDLLYDLYGGYDAIQAGGMIPLHSWLTPRSIINAAGNWNENLTVDDDGEYFCRIALNSYRIKFVKESICYYRRHTHQKNLSAQKSYQSIISTFEAIKLKQHYIKDAKLNPLLANQAMHLLCDVYPEYPALCKQIQQFIDEMGGYTWLPYQEGIHKKLRKIFGWKIVRLLSFYKNRP